MVLEVIKQRRSVRNYKNEPIADEKIKELIKAAQFAPTANNNRAVEYIIVKEQRIKDKIYEVSQPKQEFVKTAPVLIIPFTDTTKTNLAVQDLSLASQNIFLQATALGLGSVWKNFYPPVAKKVQNILHIPEKYQLINVIPIGLADAQRNPYTESDFDPTKIHQENYPN